MLKMSYDLNVIDLSFYFRLNAPLSRFNLATLLLIS